MPQKKILRLSLVLWLTFPVFAQTEIRLLDSRSYQEFLVELSGIRAKDYVLGICQHNRTEGAYENTGYEKAVRYVISILKEAGVEEVELHTYPSDGTIAYGTWRSNPGFSVRSARLYITRPFRSKWCDFSRIPISLMPYSNGSGVEEAEVIYVGSGSSQKDYEGKDVSGKIAFADRGDAATVMREAVLARGALGILMGFSGSSRRGEFPKLVELNRLYINGEESKTSKWGFSLSKAQTESLKNLLESNRKVYARAEVYAETFAGHMPVISAAIRGTRYPEQEIIYMAHLDHYKPGANDNASGSAGMLEIATTLQRMISRQAIPRPLRTMRFLWVPEWEGTAAYIENQREQARKGIIGINLDMIGEDLEECQTKLLITTPPWSQPSFLEALVEYFAKFVDEMNITTRVGSNSKFNYRIIGYFGESDHMLFNDARIGVPSTMLVHLEDRFWHTSFDTPDKVDPTELERTIFLGTFLGWTAANYKEDHLDDLLELTFSNLLKKIDRYTLRYFARMKQSSSKSLHVTYRNILKYYDLLSDYGRESLHSIVKNVPGSDYEINNAYEKPLEQYIELQKSRTLRLYRDLCADKGVEPAHAESTPLENECRRIVPERKVDQSLNYWLAVEIMRQKGLLRSMNYDIFWEMLNLTDGKNDLVRIRDGVSGQFREISLQQVKTLYEELKARDIVSY